jgi:hypothetical protein
MTCKSAGKCTDMTHKRPSMPSIRVYRFRPEAHAESGGFTHTHHILIVKHFIAFTSAGEKQYMQIQDIFVIPYSGCIGDESPTKGIKCRPTRWIGGTQDASRGNKPLGMPSISRHPDDPTGTCTSQHALATSCQHCMNPLLKCSVSQEKRHCEKNTKGITDSTEGGMACASGT